MCCRDNKLECIINEIHGERVRAGDDFYRTVAAIMWDKDPGDVTEEEYELVKKNLISALGGNQGDLTFSK